MHDDARIEGYHYCMPLETLLALNYHNSFILTVGIIGVDSHARDMYGNSHTEGTCILLEVPSMHKVQYVQSLCTCRNEDIYELEDVRVANFEVDLCSSNVEYCSISNLIAYTSVLVNSAVLWHFVQCVTLLLIHVDTGLQDLYLLLLVMGIHCTV